MDFNRMDIAVFGHLLEPHATRQELEEGAVLLARAKAAAEKEMATIEASLDSAFRLGRGPHYKNDARWQQLEIRAGRLERIEFTVRQLAAKAVWEADFGFDPYKGKASTLSLYRLCLVTEGDKQLRQKAMTEAEDLATKALAGLQVWRITGEGLVDQETVAAVKEYEQAAVQAKKDFESVTAQLLFNRQLQIVKVTLDTLVARARALVPEFKNTGEKSTAFLRYKWAKENFEQASVPFNATVKAMGPRPRTYALPSAAACSSTAPQGSGSSTENTAASNYAATGYSLPGRSGGYSSSGSAAPGPSTSPSKPATDSDDDLRFEHVGSDRDSPRPLGRRRHYGYVGSQQPNDSGTSASSTVATRPKNDLDLRKKLPDGSYIDVVLRDVQYVRQTGGQGMTLSNRPYDVLRIDFCDPTKPLPACAAAHNDDDFDDDSVFSDPQVIASLSKAK